MLEANDHEIASLENIVDLQAKAGKAAPASGDHGPKGSEPLEFAFRA
jgi:hypothetical protein